MKKRLAVGAVLTAVVAAVATSTAFASPGYSNPCCSVERGGWHGYVTRSPHTSCPFARRVAVKAMRNIMAYGPGRFWIHVYSPVTYRSYWMRCAARGNVYSYRGVHASCRGGIGASVTWRAWSS
jgi:hypothetical protein